MSYTITEALARYTEWDTKKQALHVREGHPENSPSADEWADSDDEGVELTHILAELLRRPITVWTCAVSGPDTPGLVATVHATEEECWEHLREHYDPEGMADDEPPVAIVAHLEDVGWLINVDVHEVAR